MIRELLRREFLLKSGETLVETTDRTVRAAADSENLRRLLEENEVSVEDLEEAKAALRSAIDDERRKSRGEEKKSLFIPKDAVLSLAQSALQEYCEEKRPAAVKQKSETGVDALDGQGEVAVTDQTLEQDFAKRLIRDAPDGLLNDFELGDIGWANCLLAIGIRNFRGRHPFNPQPAEPYRIENRARVVLFSDWGSGLPRAQRVAAQVRRELEKAAADNRQAHLIHLGDVYYSGWEREYKKHVLPYWSVKENEADRFSSWCLNGNHDMYSGGKGYFESLLGDARFKHQQQSSFFSLENDNFLLLGLDTGYHDQRFKDPHDLYGTQNEWAHERLTAKPDKAGILLSHHQPFSAFEKGGEKLLGKLKPSLDAKLVKGWFWGHEHRCAVYKEQHNIKYPRCIGHGGIPFYVNNDDLPDNVLYEFREGMREGLENWNYFGFAVLDFDDDKISVRYLNEFGEKHYSETISK